MGISKRQNKVDICLFFIFNCEYLCKITEKSRTSASFFVIL